MADVKISGLPASTTPLAGTEVLPIVQSGVTKKVANNDLRPKQIQSNATTGVLQVAGPGAGATRVMTTPDANFTVARTDAAQTFTGDQTFGTISTSAYAAISTTINRSGDFGQSLQFVRAGVAGNAGFGLANDNAIGFYTANTERWRVNSTGNLVAAASGLGIDFSATAGTGTSELLADYEEGDWTPVYVAATGTLGAITYENVQGTYVKIGRQVTVTGGFYCSAFDAGTGSGDLRVGGLPFTNSSVFSTAAVSDSRLFTLNNPTSGFVNVSATTTTLFYRTTANGAINNLQVSDAATGAGALNLVYFTATYQV